MSPLDLKQGKTPTFTLIALLALLAAGFVVSSLFRHQDAESLKASTEREVAAPKLVTTTRVQLGQPKESVQLPGSVSALYESILYSRVNGFVEKWRADIGDRVHQGQVLAVLSTPDLDADLNAARAKLDADQAEVLVRKASRELAQLNFERWRDSPKGVVADQERDAKKADYEAATAQVAAAEARVAQDRAEVARLSTLAEFKTVLAPFDGVITERKIDLGQLVSAGSTASTAPLYKIADDHELRVFVDVPQSMAAFVHPGVDADITLSGKEDLHVFAKLTRTSNAVDGVSRTLRAEIDIPNPGKTVASGLYVQVSLKVTLPPQPELPAAALQFKEGGPRVAIIGADHRVHFQAVKISEDLGERVRISEGVQNGDTVILNINSQIAEGDVVSPAGK